MRAVHSGNEGRTSLPDLFSTFARIGVLSFGGPAGQIALMHRILVDEKKWISDDRFLHALNFCMLLPGPEAMQLATYCGWLKRGIAGGLIAGLLFVLPGAVVLIGLSALYVAAGDLPAVAGAFFGLKAAVVALVVEALLRVSRRALKSWTAWVIAAAAFIALAFFGVPFPLVVAFGALVGLMLLRRDVAPTKDTGSPVNRRAILLVIISGGFLWALPLVLLDGVLSDIARLFSVAAVVTFGGAYAVLAHVADVAVREAGWLSLHDMATGLGLAETTPGPLILVLVFVGFLAAARDAGGVDLVHGLAGAGVTLWVTFVPCFIWIFVGAPFVERVRGHAEPAAALAGVTSAVVGVIASLALWFAGAVFFPATGTLTERIETPDWAAIIIAFAAALALMRWHVALGWVLAGSVVAGIVLRLAGLA